MFGPELLQAFTAAGWNAVQDVRRAAAKGKAAHVTWDEVRRRLPKDVKDDQEDQPSAM